MVKGVFIDGKDLLPIDGEENIWNLLKHNSFTYKTYVNVARYIAFRII